MTDQGNLTIDEAEAWRLGRVEGYAAALRDCPMASRDAEIARLRTALDAALADLAAQRAGQALRQ